MAGDDGVPSRVIVCGAHHPWSQSANIGQVGLGWAAGATRRMAARSLCQSDITSPAARPPSMASPSLSSIDRRLQHPRPRLFARQSLTTYTRGGSGQRLRERTTIITAARAYREDQRALQIQRKKAGSVSNWSATPVGSAQHAGSGFHQQTGASPSRGPRGFLGKALLTASKRAHLDLVPLPTSLTQQPPRCSHQHFSASRAPRWPLHTPSSHTRAGEETT